MPQKFFNTVEQNIIHFIEVTGANSSVQDKLCKDTLEMTILSTPVSQSKHKYLNLIDSTEDEASYRTKLPSSV